MVHKFSCVNQKQLLALRAWLPIYFSWIVSAPDLHTQKKATAGLCTTYHSQYGPTHCPGSTCNQEYLYGHGFMVLAKTSTTNHPHTKRWHGQGGTQRNIETKELISSTKRNNVIFPCQRHNNPIKSKENRWKMNKVQYSPSPRRNKMRAPKG